MNTTGGSISGVKDRCVELTLGHSVIKQKDSKKVEMNKARTEFEVTLTLLTLSFHF